MDTPREWKKREDFYCQSPKSIILAFEPNISMERKTLMRGIKTFRSIHVLYPLALVIDRHKSNFLIYIGLTEKRIGQKVHTHTHIFNITIRHVIHEK